MSGFVKVQFKDGEKIFSAGDPADKLYILEKGKIQLLDATAGQPFAQLKEGESFGEQAILTHGVRSAAARALGDVECIEITAAGLRQLLANQPSIVTSMFEALLLQLHMHNSLHQQG
jgi:CRP-like cAMP-binding protein